MRRSVRFAAIAVAIVVAAPACAGGGSPPGMRTHTPRAHTERPELVELARAEGSPATRALLVVYPRSACSGSASTVLLDERGRFVGAVAPGTAALVDVPVTTKTLSAISSVEVTAPVGMWSVADVVRVPPPPGGLLLETWRWNTRLCSNGHYADVRPASKEELETALGDADLQWLAPQAADGQAWIDAHRARVDEVLAADRAYRARGGEPMGFPAGPLPAVHLGAGPRPRNHAAR